MNRLFNIAVLEKRYLQQTTLFPFTLFALGVLIRELIKCRTRHKHSKLAWPANCLVRQAVSFARQRRIHV